MLYAPFNDNFLHGYDIESVFAFDNMIINIDRGGMRGKPDLYVNEDLRLIDYEQALPFYNSLMDESFAEIGTTLGISRNTVSCVKLFKASDCSFKELLYTAD